jgi:hypothetical protein
MDNKNFTYSGLDIKFNNSVRLLQDIKVETFAFRSKNRVYKLIHKGTIAYVLSYDTKTLHQVPLLILNISTPDGDINIDNIPEWLVEKIEDVDTPHK